MLPFGSCNKKSSGGMLKMGRKAYQGATSSLLGGIAALLLCPTIGLSQTDAQQIKSSNAFAQSPQKGTVVDFDTAVPAIPSAKEVIVDLPSAFHSSRYQEGEVNGLRYVLFPDGSGKVLKGRTLLYRMNCTASISCVITSGSGLATVVPANGGPKPAMLNSPDGLALSRYLASWILAGTGKRPEIIIAAPTEEPPVLQAQAPALQAEATLLETAAANIQTTAVRAEAQPAAPAQISTGQDAELAEAQIPSVAQPTLKPNVAACGGEGQECSVPSKPAIVVSALPKQQVVSRSAKKTMHKLVSVKPKHAKKKPAAPRAVPIAQPARRETIFQRMNLSCSITGSVTLRYKNHNSGSERFGKPRASLGCGAKLSEKLTLRVSVIGYGDKNEKSPSDADFTYALNYRATDKLSFSYSNYSARFDSSVGTFVDSLTAGALRARYKLPKIKLPNEKTIGCSASVNLLKLKQSSANLSCSYAVSKKLRISATAYAYFAGQQDSWDPDFAYSASYRINKDWSISYSNYGNNRFFWNKTSNGGEGILGGTVSVSYKFKF